MGRVITNVFRFLGYMILTLILVLFYSVKYLLCGKSVIGRIAILGMYSGMIASFVYVPVVFRILLIGMLLIDLLFAFSMVKNEGKRNADNSYEQNYRVYKNPFFEGMSFDEAKKEYRKLMKKYHPDNIDGSLEMTQKIAEAYSNYCTACGR